MNTEDLPLRASVAYAVRSARRVQPLTVILSGGRRASVDQAIAIAESYATGSRITEQTIKDAAQATKDAAETASAIGLLWAAQAAYAAQVAIKAVEIAQDVAKAAYTAAQAAAQDVAQAAAKAAAKAARETADKAAGKATDWDDIFDPIHSSVYEPVYNAVYDAADKAAYEAAYETADKAAYGVVVDKAAQAAEKAAAQVAYEAAGKAAKAAAAEVAGFRLFRATTTSFTDDAVKHAISAAAAAAGDAAAIVVRAAAALDVQRLIHLDLGPPYTLGSPVDPSEAGPLGHLWPEGAPDWFTNPPVGNDEQPAGDSELVVEIEVPEDASNEDVLAIVGEVVQQADALHRAYGGHGLKVDSLGIYKGTPVSKGVPSA